MGADFMCCYVPAAKIDEHRKQRLLEIVAGEQPREWVDYGYDSPRGLPEGDNRCRRIPLPDCPTGRPR